MRYCFSWCDPFPDNGPVRRGRYRFLEKGGNELLTSGQRKVFLIKLSLSTLTRRKDQDEISFKKDFQFIFNSSTYLGVCSKPCKSGNR